MERILEYLPCAGSFLFGVAVGVLVEFLGGWLTDCRRERQAKRRADAEFLKVKAQMPGLIAEMRKDLGEPENQTVRSFFVTNRLRGVMPDPDERVLFYYFEDHPDLAGKIAILENHGYVLDITPVNAKEYRMTEYFVEMVLTS